MNDEVIQARGSSLFIKHHGLWFVVLAVFDNDDKANAYMTEHRNAAVLVTQGDFVFLADKRDIGAAVPKL